MSTAPQIFTLFTDRLGLVKGLVNIFPVFPIKQVGKHQKHT